MQDSELKKILLETCPVRPGQEARAWAALKDRLNNERLNQSAWPGSTWNWIYYPTWRGLAVAVLALVLLPFAGNFLWSRLQPKAFATADSQSPGIYATAFYSRSADAQVVWLNGMEPASDKPTYLDPTTVLGEKPEPATPVGDPNSL
jgi:hypothetical protein